MKSILIVSIISILFFVGLSVSDTANAIEVIKLQKDGSLEKSDIKGFIKIRKSRLGRTWTHLNVSMIQKIEVAAGKQILDKSVIWLYTGVAVNPIPVKIIIPSSLMSAEDVVKLIASVNDS
jgi:hypothetical protein